MERPKNKLKPIRVETLPNGYGLKVGKHEYLAYNDRELLECMFVHIGLQVGDYMNKQTIRDIMSACANYPDGTKALEEIVRLEGVIKELREKINTLQVNTRWHNEQIKHKEEVNVKLRQELKQLKREHPKRMRKHQVNIDELTPLEEYAKEKGLIK